MSQQPGGGGNFVGNPNNSGMNGPGMMSPNPNGGNPMGGMPPGGQPGGGGGNMNMGGYGSPQQQQQRMRNFQQQQQQPGMIQQQNNYNQQQQQYNQMRQQQMMSQQQSPQQQQHNERDNTKHCTTINNTQHRIAQHGTARENERERENCRTEGHLQQQSENIGTQLNKPLDNKRNRLALNK